ncbi:MAG: GNAT family N-acetyltransferase [Micropruina glycogenica]
MTTTAGVHAVVRPDRRQQGIGTALFDAAEQRPPPRAGTP